MTHRAPDIEAVAVTREALGEAILRTPVLRCAGLEDLLDNGTVVHGKLEFLQRTGTFKARGALASVRALSLEQLEPGITAVSAGNHAIAAAYAARATGTQAKVVMIETANPYRIAAAKRYGAEVLVAGDAHAAFEVAEAIQRDEGRTLVHPFEGPGVALGAGTLGLEICEQLPDFEVLLVPVGGGGLIAGVSNAVKQLRPDCTIIGIEPEGADSMHRSFASGKPESIDRVRTIADSLGAPYALPYSFALTRQNVDDLALVSDDALRRAMGTLYHRMKFAVEPACAAATAALLGPLRERLAGKRVAVLFCGSNIDWATWQEHAILD